MTDTISLNVRISGALKDFVTHEVNQGAYENNSEYVRDLIRRDKERQETARLQSLKMELQNAFATSDTDYAPVTAADIRTRAASRLKPAR
jgi:putative addiction module CopG family antidote